MSALRTRGQWFGGGPQGDLDDIYRPFNHFSGFLFVKMVVIFFIKKKICLTSILDFSFQRS